MYIVQQPNAIENAFFIYLLISNCYNCTSIVADHPLAPPKTELPTIIVTENFMPLVNAETLFNITDALPSNTEVTSSQTLLSLPSLFFLKMVLLPASVRAKVILPNVVLSSDTTNTFRTLTSLNPADNVYRSQSLDESLAEPEFPTLRFREDYELKLHCNYSLDIHRFAVLSTLDEFIKEVSKIEEATFVKLLASKAFLDTLSSHYLLQKDPAYTFKDFKKEFLPQLETLLKLLPNNTHLLLLNNLLCHSCDVDLQNCIRRDFYEKYPHIPVEKLSWQVETESPLSSINEDWSDYPDPKPPFYQPGVNGFTLFPNPMNDPAAIHNLVFGVD
jgi:hypothetical protein